MREISYNKSIQLSTSKSFEFQVEFNRPRDKFEIDLFRFTVIFNRKTDHAGFDFTFEFLELLFVSINIYDHRHWDYDKNHNMNNEEFQKELNEK